MALLDRISPDQLPSASHCMKAAAYYIHGLQSFFSSQYGESKRYLRETLKMANAEDLNRLTSCSLVLLGHIFLSLGNGKESMNMVTPAMQLAAKIPDVHVQLWASAILKVSLLQYSSSLLSLYLFNIKVVASRQLLCTHLKYCPRCNTVSGDAALS